MSVRNLCYALYSLSLFLWCGCQASDVQFELGKPADAGATEDSQSAVESPVTAMAPDAPPGTPPETMMSVDSAAATEPAPDSTNEPAAPASATAGEDTGQETGEETGEETGQEPSADMSSEGAMMPEASADDSVMEPPAPACVEGELVCAGATLQRCSEGALTKVADCPSARHCMLGAEIGACATCLPGQDHQCTGEKLEVCNERGDGFVLLETCDSAALCKVDARSCTTRVCEPDARSCDGDTLRLCNADGSAFVVSEQQQCQKGRCDELRGACRICDPGAKDCAGDQPRTCNAEGSGYVMANACAGTAPVCVDGSCVQCQSATDCRLPGNLHESCARMTCESQQCVPDRRSLDGQSCEAFQINTGLCENGLCTEACGDGQPQAGEECDPKLTNTWHCSNRCRVQGSPTAFTPCSSTAECTAPEKCFVNGTQQLCVPVGVASYCRSIVPPPFQVTDYTEEGEDTLVQCSLDCTSAPCPSHTECITATGRTFCGK